MMFAALGQSFLFNAAIGQNSVGLKIGIVSDELVNFKECDDSSLVTTNLTTDEYEDDICILNKISCRFIREMSDKIGDKVYFKSFEEGHQAIKSGKLIGLIHFTSNFSASNQRFFEGFVGEDDEVIEEILDNREIKVYLDRTDFHSSNLIQKKLFDVYKIYIESLAKDCKLADVKYKLDFLSFEKPIYGESDINIIDHMGPMTVLMFFCLGNNSSIIDLN